MLSVSSVVEVLEVLCPSLLLSHMLPAEHIIVHDSTSTLSTLFSPG